MEDIFKKTGYILSDTKTHCSDKTLKLMWFNNPDGSPRWIWNAKNTQPTFLKFYNKGSKRASLIQLLIKLIFFIKIQHLIFPKKRFYYPAGLNPTFDCNKIWALFTGTTGPNNKAVLYANDAFYKIALTENSRNLIKQEHLALTAIKNKSTDFVHPDSCVISDEVVQLSDISHKGQRTTALSALHCSALRSLSKISQSNVLLHQWEYFQQLVTAFNEIADDRIPNNLLRKIKLLLSELDQQDEIVCTLSHGDFTSWNMYTTGHSLAIYDWELASNKRSLGFDYFHYIFQNGIMVERKCWKSIGQQIMQKQESENFSSLFNQDKNAGNKYLKYYLLINAMEYLQVYAAQKEWHPQISWLYQVWNEAFNFFLTEQYSKREMLITDIFDYLHNESYASLKFPNQYPEQLKIDADIDLVLPKNTTAKLEQFIRQHAFVAFVTLEKKSFMHTLQVSTVDQEILSLDLIFELKRKNLFLLSSSEILGRSMRNIYGVKIASELDTARFIAAFYILNGQSIPASYLHYGDCLLCSNLTDDKIFKKCYSNGLLTAPELLHMIEKRKENSGLQRWWGQLIYALDSLKTMLFHRGFIITFSGVDGAGKSTVIEHTAKLLEKQLRKRVIVIRHRPSILPILSVWSKGKEKAHQDAIQSLPRQGNNKSLVSSLFRFAYYYSDYLMGQFIIQFRYIMRGYLVIYDRYYFDFINDSKRSNIMLPKWLPAFFYRFLLKPKFNFFLFADADTILKRKKELSESTIEELTADYTFLFNSLQLKSKKANYTSIKNDVLETTLNTVLNTVKAH